MANILSREKQVQVVSALAEGAGIRAIERMANVHRDTVMRLGVRVGQGCCRILDRIMRNITCDQLQLDEIWGFIKKKQKNVKPGEIDAGDIWTFIAIESESKPCRASRWASVTLRQQRRLSVTYLTDWQTVCRSVPMLWLPTWKRLRQASAATSIMLRS